MFRDIVKQFEIIFLSVAPQCHVVLFEQSQVSSSCFANKSINKMKINRMKYW